MSGRVGSIPTRSRQPRDASTLPIPPPGRMPLSRVSALIRPLLVAVMIGVAPATLLGQTRPDTAAAAPAPAAVARPSALGSGPPISPKTAFLHSLLVPGWGQTELGRPTAASVFMAIEVLSIGLARKTAVDLRYAKSRADVVTFDSVVTGASQVVTGADTSLRFTFRVDTVRNRFAGNRVKSRRTQYEDWIAVLAFNHLFAAADAFVAAQLWDLPASVRTGGSRRAAWISVSAPW